MSDSAHCFEVADEDEGQRLDVYLSGKFPEASRVRIRRGIDDGSAQVDERRRKASYRVQPGQQIEFSLPADLPSGPEPEPTPLSILYEDEAIAVIDKPPGMVVHPAKGHWSGTMASALVYHFENLSTYGGDSRPGIVHRLDRDTSGVIVVAKTDTAHANLAAQFHDRTVSKEYLAIVFGCPDRDRDMIDQPIGEHPTHREKKALRSGHSSSREAQTFYEVEERFTGFALIKALPKTGRTHQIRLHLLHAHCPVLCDKLYGGQSRLSVADLRTRCRQKNLVADFDAEHLLLERQALHAHRLKLTHPTTGEEIEFCAPLPDDMQQVLLALRQSIKSK